MQKTLTELRQEISRIDEKLVKILADRMTIALEISQVKHEQGLPIKDEKREKKVIEKIINIPHSPMKTDDLKMIYRQIIHLSREAQNRVL